MDQVYGDNSEEFDPGKIVKGGQIRLTARRYTNAVSGKVVDAKGESVMGATIRVEPKEMQSQMVRQASVTTTDNYGEFRAEGLAFGEVTLRVSGGPYRPLTLKTKSDRTGLVIVLR